MIIKLLFRKIRKRWILFKMRYTWNITQNQLYAFVLISLSQTYASQIDKTKVESYLSSKIYVLLSKLYPILLKNWYQSKMPSNIV